MEGAGLRMQGAGLRVQGAGLRVQGAGLRVQGAGVACSSCARRSLPASTPLSSAAKGFGFSVSYLLHKCFTFTSMIQQRSNFLCFGCKIVILGWNMIQYYRGF